MANVGKVANEEKEVEASLMNTEKLLGSKFLEDIVSSTMLDGQTKLLEEGNFMERKAPMEEKDIDSVQDSSSETGVSDGLRRSTNGMSGIGENHSVESVSNNMSGRKLLEEEEHVEVGKWKEDEKRDTNCKYIHVSFVRSYDVSVF